jgi:serine/threonine-protein kinase
MPGTVRPPALSIDAPAISVADTAFAGRNSSSRVDSMSDLPKICPTCQMRYPAGFMVCPRDAAQLTEVGHDEESDEMVGQTIASSYTITRVLGEGGMGRVYEARHTRIPGKRFAVKMLHPEYAREPEVLTRFQREAEAAASIRSPNVVDVYDVDRMPDGRAFLVCEFLDGKELGGYLDEVGKLPVGPAVKIVRQVCKAMAAAHDRGVIHRDMKPENVFLTGDPGDPLAKVIDFGISRVGDQPGTALTKTGMIMGTPSYMAPEQARGERVDHRADIYAVGAILYCALTGERPFDRGDPTATLTAVLTQDPRAPRAIEPSIPAPLEMIIQKAMAKRPEDRHQSMAELDHDLLAYEPIAGSEGSTLSIPSASWARTTGSELVRSASLDKQVRQVTQARPLILTFSALGLLGAAGGLILAITGIIRAVKGGGARANLEILDAALLSAGVVFTLLTPVILAIRHLSRSVWGNSVKAVDLAEKLRRPVMVGLTAYGFAWLLVRLLESVIFRHAVGVAWPWWDVILFFLALAAGGGAFLLGRMEKRRV